MEKSALQSRYVPGPLKSCYIGPLSPIYSIAQVKEIYYYPTFLNNHNLASYNLFLTFLRVEWFLLENLQVFVNVTELNLLTYRGIEFSLLVVQVMKTVLSRIVWKCLGIALTTLNPISERITPVLHRVFLFFLSSSLLFFFFFF